MPHASTVVYVANADSGDLSVLRLDAARGTLSPIQTVPVGGEVMPLATSPDHRVLHAAIRSQPYEVASFRIDPASGRLTAIGRSLLPDSMASIAVDRSGRTLFGASYGGHRMSLSPIGADGAAQAATQVWPTGRNAHQVLVDPSNRFVFVSNLGDDAVLQFGFDAATRTLTPNLVPRYEGRKGAGPRHLRFHPGGRFVHLLNELDATVDTLGFDEQAGTLSLRHTVSALPPGFEGRPWAADLHLTPDGRWLYASERTSSTLSVFAVDGVDGRLACLSNTLTEAQPRGFGIDPGGRFLVAAGQRSNAVSLYRIDPDDGGLTLLARQRVGRNPNWVEILALG